MISPQPRPSSVTPTISAVKGHLVTKSSALATSNCKLETQFITAQHMASHYKRVINARKMIDNNPPKSLTTSQKARDRVRRELAGSVALNKSLNSQRARSADPFRESQSIDDQKALNSNPTTARQTRSARVTKNEKSNEIKPRTLPDQQKLNKSMANMMTQFTLNNKNRVLTIKPETARMSTRNFYDDVQGNDTQMMTKARPLMANEFNIEDKTKTALNALIFSAKNPESSQGFHPALTAMSRLVSGHSYDVMEIHPDRFTQPSKEFEPRIKNREKSKSSLIEQRSCYQPPRVRRRNTKTVQVKPKPIQREAAPVEDEIEEELNESRAVQDQRDLRRNLEAQVLNENRQNQIKFRKAMEKEEELKYLEFIKTVTDDILARGISSNRVINNCFEYHIKRNKHLLDERKMRDLLETLRVDIGVPIDDYENTNLNASHYQSVNKAVSMDRGQNREDMPDLGNYLTLQKFGWSSINNPPRVPLKEKESNQKLNTSANMNVWQQLDADASMHDINQPKTSSRRESTKSIQFNQTDNLFDTYENQIARNIQSIRRNSLGNSDSPNEKSIHESVPASQKSSQTSVKQSILKKSPEQSRHNSNSGESRGPGSPVGKKTQLLSNQNTSNLSNLSGALKSSNHGTTNGDEDDDDDVFSSNYASPKKSPTHSKENINASKQTITKKTIMNTSNTSISKGHNQSHVKDEYADDILFNDNYGEEEESQAEKSLSRKSHSNSPHSPARVTSPKRFVKREDEDSTDYEGPFSNDEDDDDDDTDKFNKLLKTKSFHKDSPKNFENAARRRSSGNSTIRSGEYDDELASPKGTRRSSNESGAQETPRPAPRKASNPRYQAKPSVRSDDEDD